MERQVLLKFFSILKVKITKVNKKQQMPIIASRGDGRIDYINDIPEGRSEPQAECEHLRCGDAVPKARERTGIVIIDSTTLEDYIKFQHIEYELIDGVYYNDGGNKRLGELIQTLFNRRLEAKKAKQDALQQTLKLMLNSAYGKTIQKPTSTKNNIINKDKCVKDKATGEWKTFKDANYTQYVFNHYKTIEKMIDLSPKQVCITEFSIDKSYNRSQCGAMILSYSKRIMNEVFDCANDLKVNIYYTDTDSIHIDYDGVKPVEDEYRRRYNKELNGKQLGQFHIDFDLKGADSEVYAIKSLFLGKKSYIDVLECVNKDGSVMRGFHKRLKGITSEGLEHASKSYPVSSYLGLYEHLAKGNEVDIVLNPYNPDTEEQKVLFDFKRCSNVMRVSTKQEFRRMVRF